MKVSLIRDPLYERDQVVAVVGQVFQEPPKKITYTPSHILKNE